MKSSPRQLSLIFADNEIIPKSKTAAEMDIEPLDATFRDSNRAPLHSWFPYLEGYSPRFVDRVRLEYLPNARRIIEPFAGSGTTPIALGQSGVDCAYSEANPAMAFIIETKLALLRATKQDRIRISEELLSLDRAIPALMSTTKPNKELAESYLAAFGSSRFFEDEALDQVRTLRTIADQILSTNTMLGNCLTLAILASLIKTSQLKRAGDLRFKTPKELLTKPPLPIEAVSARLQSQAKDLLNLPGLTGNAWHACNAAADLGDQIDDGWDGVITSPPYLNGTNYIRNARLELWFLRLVNKKGDLREIRDIVITSGINDVDAQTKWAPTTSGVERTVKELTEHAYDDRIAKMVGGYFHDMRKVMASLQNRVKVGGMICIDIGDSIYSGIHVATDDLLVETAEDLGLRTVDRVHLRKRNSNGGQLLRQQLLVFENLNRTRIVEA
jgi:DNA modification methylase